MPPWTNIKNKILMVWKLTNRNSKITIPNFSPGSNNFKQSRLEQRCNITSAWLGLLEVI